MAMAFMLDGKHRPNMLIHGSDQRGRERATSVRRYRRAGTWHWHVRLGATSSSQASLARSGINAYVLTRSVPARKRHAGVCLSSRLEKGSSYASVFTALHTMQTRSSDENSVCLSVCPSHAWIVRKR